MRIAAIRSLLHSDNIMSEHKKHYFGLDDDALEAPRPEPHNGVELIPEGCDDVCGTSRVGHFGCSLKTLLDALGPSLGPSGDGKVTEEWHFMTPYGLATLYDYKGDSCSIGGQTKGVVKPLYDYLYHVICLHDKR